MRKGLIILTGLYTISVLLYLLLSITELLNFSGLIAILLITTTVYILSVEICILVRLLIRLKNQIKLKEVPVKRELSLLEKVFLPNFGGVNNE